MLEGVKACHAELKTEHGRHVILVVKIAPDMEEPEIRGVCQELLKFELDGVIVSNTTVDRQEIQQSRHYGEAGLSGAPLLARSNRALQAVVSELKQIKNGDYWCWRDYAR